MWLLARGTYCGPPPFKQEGVSCCFKDALQSVSVPGSSAFRSSNACSLRGTQLITKGVAKTVKTYSESCESHRVIERQKLTARTWVRSPAEPCANPSRCNAFLRFELGKLRSLVCSHRLPMFRQGGCWRGQWQSRLAVKLISKRVCPVSDRSKMTNPFRKAKQNEAVALTGPRAQLKANVCGPEVHGVVLLVQDGWTESRNSYCSSCCFGVLPCFS